MDKKKAEFILQLDKYADAHEAYEDLLFGLKTLILNQGVIPKVLRKRQDRLNIIHSAYSFHTKTEPINLTPQKLSVVGKNWEELFLSYEKNKSKFKLDLAIGTNALSLADAIDGLINNQKLWSKHFVFDYTQINLPTLGKEMDSMELLGLLRANKNTELKRLPKKCLKNSVGS